jgi:dTDP-4-amino-4,6-dideoxygalactose transaminase
MPTSSVQHAYYRMYAYIRPDGLGDGWSRDRIVAELNQASVQVMQGTCPEVYREKAFDGTGYRPRARLPVARELGETSLMFFTHPTMSDEELDHAVNATDQVLKRAAR